MLPSSSKNFSSLLEKQRHSSISFYILYLCNELSCKVLIGSFKLFVLQYHCVRDSKGEAYSSQCKFPNCWSCELYCKVRVIKLQYLLCSDQLVLISTKHLTAAVCLGGKKCNIIIWCNLQAQIRNLDELGIFLIKGQECRKEVVLLSLMLALCTL